MNPASSSPAFALDSRLQADTIPVGDLALSAVLLMDDARFPWFVLVPRREGITEMTDLTDGEAGPELYLRASVTALDGSDAVRGSVTGPLGEAAALGRALAAELLDRGAAALMAAPQDPEHAPDRGPGSRSTR